MRTPAVISALALSASLAGCGLASEEDLRACRAGLPTAADVNITEGTEPEFSWTGGSVRSLLVTEGTNPPSRSQQSVVWSVEASGEGVITSPVVYGETPEGAVVHVEAAELEEETVYGLWLGDFVPGLFGAEPCLWTGAVPFQP